MKKLIILCLLLVGCAPTVSRASFERLVDINEKLRNNVDFLCDARSKSLYKENKRLNEQVKDLQRKESPDYKIRKEAEIKELNKAIDKWVCAQSTYLADLLKQKVDIKFGSPFFLDVNDLTIAGVVVYITPEYMTGSLQKFAVFRKFKNWEFVGQAYYKNDLK